MRWRREKIDSLYLVQQYAFDKITGLPRWGCYALTHGGMPQFALGRALNKQEWEEIYHTLREENVLDLVGTRLDVRDPQRLVRIVADYMAPGELYVKHLGDEKGTLWPGEPDYLVREYRTKRGGSHWMLEIPIGGTIYDPGLKTQIRHRTSHYLRWACRRV